MGAGAATDTPVPDQAFPQEVTRRIPDSAGANLSEGRLLDVSPAGEVRFFAAGRWYSLKAETATELPNLRCEGGETFVFADEYDQPIRVPVPWKSVVQVLRKDRRHWIATRDELYEVSRGILNPAQATGHGEWRQMALDPENRLWAASSAGLFRRRQDTWERVIVADEKGRTWDKADVRGIAFDGKGRPWVALLGGVATRTEDSWRILDGRDGLPYDDFTCVVAAPEGVVWFGTRRGAVRYDGMHWAYREGPRWLPGDEIRQIAIDTQGTTWFATSGGPGGIEARPMTLAKKAAYYEQEIEQYLKRTEYGFLSEVGLKAPGDRSGVIHSDSDNDGLWTAMYGAGECFAAAATGKAEHRQRARQAFEALRFLQKVTQGGAHSPPKGYVARTVRPVTWPDPNVGRFEADLREQREGDPLWKAYEPRWPKSADGRWYWKSDTSSDELDGHYFFHARYFDLVADEAEKVRVREVVRDLTDHLLTHDFCLIDHDGTPTRWGIFSPRHLNHDPNWWVERGLNSLSMLSYLAVAGHITGDPKYGQAAKELIDRHGYGANVMNPKTQTGPGSGNQSDDEMAFMCFYNLLSYTREPRWREKWLYAFHVYAALELPEMNPFFNFSYAAFGQGQKYRNSWGEFTLDPWAGWIDDAVATLRGFPLDRINWPQRNSHRLDLVRLPPQQSTDLYEPSARQRGHRVNGKVLPVAERHFNHWNTDPWRLDYGGNGRELASGTVFLLPYYMGLHHRFISHGR